jgi:hypothetical protein
VTNPQDPFAKPPPLPPEQQGPPPGYGPPPPGYGPPPPGYGPPPPGYGPPPPGYGQPPGSPYGQWQPYPQQRRTNGLAIAALVCGILGGCFGITGIVAIVLGAVALGQIKQSGQEGKGLAIAGIVLGALWIVALAAIFLVGGVISSDFERTCDTISTDGSSFTDC